MLNDFNETMNDLTVNRITDIGSTVMANNERYQELRERSISIFAQIRDLLPAEHKSLLIEYEEVNSEELCITEEIMYQQGLKDGASLQKFLQ